LRAFAAVIAAGCAAWTGAIVGTAAGAGVNAEGISANGADTVGAKLPCIEETPPVRAGVIPVGAAERTPPMGTVWGPAPPNSPRRTCAKAGAETPLISTQQQKMDRAFLFTLSPFVVPMTIGVADHTTLI
jgi:hypothetical protein